MNTRKELIEYFHRGPVDGSESIDFATVNKKAVKLGWLIPPECCNKSVMNWLDTLTTNYNATFYKEWNDVISKNRFEILVDQLLHYASTYGKLMEGEEPEGNGYVPNDGSVVPQFKDLKVLEPITVDELREKCFDILKSGIALKESTMNVICDFWLEGVGEIKEGDEAAKDKIADKISEIQNKEASVYVSSNLGVMPSDEFGMLRYLVYKYTGSAMLIKSKPTIAMIKLKAKSMERVKDKGPLVGLTEKQMKRLSRIFYRFKPLFLAMKNKFTAYTVNELRRLAVKNHRPFQIGFWESIIANTQGATLQNVKDRLPELDSWRKIRLMMLAKEKMTTDAKNGVYTIRNGRMYVREGYSPKYDKTWISQLYFALEESLVESLKGKACSVKFPEFYEIALPTSEKNFVGCFPYGTSFTLTKNNVLGVYWRNEWGTRDYDLSMIDLTGGKIGWNSAWYGWGRGFGREGREAQVIYSGDLTNANPEATELLFIRDTAPDGLIKLNKFNGNDKSQFRFFFANEELPAGDILGHMVDPNNVKFDVMVPFDGPGEKTIGVLVDGKFTLMDFTTGHGRVAFAGKYANTMVESLKNKTRFFIPLREILLRAGFTVWEPPKEGEEQATVPGLDLTKLEKDTLINLFK